MQLNIIHLKHRIDRYQKVLNQLEKQGIKEYVFWDGFRDTEKPSQGIAKAHQRIVAWASKQGLPKVLIVEDDIMFTAKGALTHFLKSEPKDYDLYLGGISYGKLKEDNSVSDFAGTHLYIIKKKFYETFLSLSGELDIDRDMEGRGKFIVCNPMVAIQTDGFSDNKKEYRDNSLYFKNRELWMG